MNSFNVFMMSFVLLISSCSLAPVKNQIKLPAQKLSADNIPKGKSRLVIFNNASFLMHGMDNSADLNISLDGKGLVQLEINKYVILDLNKGAHTFKLVHRDMVLFESEHKVNLRKSLNYIQISPTVSSNELNIVDTLPVDFNKNYANYKAN